MEPPAPKVLSTTNNRVNGVSGALTRTYTYDAAGNTLSDGSRTFTYNDAGRMTTATMSGVTTTYAYNGLGQRVRKTSSTTTAYFVYDEASHLIGEYDGAGALIQEIVWMGDIPVASIRTNEQGTGVGVFYIHSDHLNTPRRMTRPNDSSIVWRWDSDPFGNGAPNEDPDGNGQIVKMNLRFPGQYADSETGLYYNYYRTYDPAVGRYTASDPIGLDGGLNTYSYALNDPISLYDPYGLWVPPSLPQPVVDAVTGFGDAFSLFGFSPSKYIREGWSIDGGVDYCSTSYAVGEYSSAAAQLVGGAGLVRNALFRKAGTEWSHGIPERFIREFTKKGRVNPDYKAWLDNPVGRAVVNGPLNGNYVRPIVHRMSDMYRQLAGLTNADPRWSFLRQQLNRIPGWIPGAGAISSGVDGGTECGCK